MSGKTLILATALALAGCWSWSFPKELLTADAGSGGAGEGGAGDGGQAAGRGGNAAGRGGEGGGGRAGAGEDGGAGSEGGAAGQGRDGGGGADEPDAAPVGCTTAAACTEASRPVCDDVTKVCRPCRAHNECAGGLCTYDGRCPAANAIVHVAPSCPVGGGNGTAAAALCSVQAAVLRGGAYVLVKGGDYPQEVAFDKAQQFYGVDNPILRARSCSALVIRAKIVLSGFTIAGNVTVLKDVGAEARLYRNNIGGSLCPGVEVGNNSTIIMDANFVHDHTGGGLITQNSVFVLTNNIFANNGAANSAVGGVRLEARPGSSFAYNTVSANRVKGTGQDVVGGVRCDGTNVPVVSSIIWDNSNLPVSAGCDVSNSLLTQGRTIGTDNLEGNPQFEGSVPSEASTYRLQVSSPAVNKGTTRAPPLDYFANPRDRSPDLGAAEWR